MSALSPDEAAVVLRRAAELDTTVAPPADHLDEDVLRQAAAEVGLSPASVEQAVVELRSGHLAPVSAMPAARRAGLDAQVVLTRPTARVEAVERWLRSQWFEPRRRRGAVSDWEPRTGLAAKARRVADVQKRLRLQDVRTLRVEPYGDGVRLTADLADLRNGLLGGVVALPAVLIGAVIVVPGGPDALLAVPAAVAAGGLGWTGARRALTARRERVRDTLEMMLTAPVEAPPRSWLGDLAGRWSRR